MPRKDTKPIARALLEKYKSLPGVLRADKTELVKIKGIKERAAQFLLILNATIGYYFEEKAKTEEIQFAKLNDLVDYCRATIGGKHNEVVRVLFLNSQNILIQAENLSEGTASQAVAFPRKIVEGALKHRATTVIIAHNHPGGMPEPSGQDNAITQQIKSALQTVNISLQEHLIITDDGFYSYRQNGVLD